MRSKLVLRFALLVACSGWAHATPAAGDILAATSVARPAPPQTIATSTGDTAPDILLSKATSVVTARLKQRAAPDGQATGISDLLESTILPLFDFHHMTQLAVARNWKLASPQQQVSLVEEFKTLLVRTYYAALVNYRDEVIEYKPLAMVPGDTDVTVKSTIKKPGVERMTIDYDMQKLVDGWKVYDIRIGGISLTTTYRSSFAEIVRDGGVPLLIKFLTDKNHQASQGPRSDNSEARGILLLYGVAPSLLRGQH
jgi:phospholipid transport system substrate-binding protein